MQLQLVWNLPVPTLKLRSVTTVARAIVASSLVVGAEREKCRGKCEHVTLLVTSESELVTSRSQLVTSKLQLVTSKSELPSSKLVKTSDTEVSRTFISQTLPSSLVSTCGVTCFVSMSPKLSSVFTFFSFSFLVVQSSCSHT